MLETRRFCSMVAVFLFSVTPTVGQAWVPERGTGEVSVAYQNLYTKDHTLGDGSRVNVGKVRLFGLIQSFDYGITDKLAFSLSLPYGWGKYSGNSPHQLPIDDGQYHSALQDLGVGLRYNIRARPLSLTPFMRYSFPSHHYENFAHSAVGSQLHEFQIGLAAGRQLGRFLPNAYFQSRYMFSFAQRIIGVRPLRSHLDGELGYFINRRWSIRAIALTQFSHNGLNFPQDYLDRSPTNQVWRHHDQISETDFVNLGGGVSFEVTRSLSIFSSLITTLWGTNGHAIATGLTMGMSWGFSTPLAKNRPGSAMAEQSTDHRVSAAEMQPPICTSH